MKLWTLISVVEMPWAIYRGQIYGRNHYINSRGKATIYFCKTLTLTV